jgi:hypothetical protein
LFSQNAPPPPDPNSPSSPRLSSVDEFFLPAYYIRDGEFAHPAFIDERLSRLSSLLA